MKFAFPSPEQGARNQTFRLIVMPDVWRAQTRIRLSNAFGIKPVTFNNAFVGLQESGSAIVKGTNQPVLFDGKKSVMVAPGEVKAEYQLVDRRGRATSCTPIAPAMRRWATPSTCR